MASLSNSLQSMGRSLGNSLTNLAGYSAAAASRANAVSAQAQSAQGAFNQESANIANQINDQNLAAQYAYNSANMASVNDYNAEMWQKAADYNMAMWEKTKEFNEWAMYRQAELNAAEAQKNRDWQEKMSNTQYQRAMADMKAAGLNPILAYSQGGAGVPGGATASAGQASMSPTSMSSAQGQMASGGLLGANTASESNYQGQMEYLSGTLGLISAVLGSFSSGFANLGSLGDFGEGLGKALAEVLKQGKQNFSDSDMGKQAKKTYEDTEKLGKNSTAKDILKYIWDNRPGGWITDTTVKKFLK